MPSRARSGNENLPSSGGSGHGLEHRRASKQYQTSRFAKEKPSSPRAGQTLKFKEKVKAENPIRPPHAGLPLEFVRNDIGGFIVQTKFSGNEQQPKPRKGDSEEEELVKYMSKVPGYLLRGEKPQDNVLNFGVLDWGRLEKYKQNQVSSSERVNKLYSGDCSTATNGASIFEALPHQREQSSRSGVNSFQIVDPSPVVKPLNIKDIDHPHLATSCNRSSNEKREVQRKAKPRIRDDHVLNSAKGKEKQSDQGTVFVKETSSSKQTSLKKKISVPDGEPMNLVEKLKGLDLNNPSQRCSGKQDNIVLLLPKDFCRPESSEMPQRASLDGKSAEFNWGSFSDIFSVDEIQSDVSLSDVQHSCPLPYTFEDERDLDLKLDSLVKAQGVELPVSPPLMPLYSKEKNVKEDRSTSTTIKASGDLDEREPRRFSFSEVRMGRSLSYKEGSSNTHLKSTYVGPKSGPAKPQSSSACETPIGNKTNISTKTRNSPFRRLLDPLLKHKALNRTKEHPNDLRMNPSTDVEVPASCEEREPSTVKALLHLTITGGLPLFKFMVEADNEILASTVKSLSTFGKDDSRWLYTFYSVHKIKKKSAGWKNNKAKPCGFSYNVIGQMKVSNPKIPSWCDVKFDEQYMVKESVLYSVELGRGNAASSELMTSRELAAIVVKMPNENAKNNCSFSEGFSNKRLSNFGEDNEILGQTVVILPGGFHSVPNDGVPSPLINRWRTGGLCDCGGWDVGCKLRILTNPIEEGKTLRNSGLSPMQTRCDLFEKGEPKERGPFLSLIPFRDGLFSVEFGAEISALQAFSICVAIINSQMPTDSLEQKFDSAKASMVARGEVPGKHATPLPPHSPVGRV